MYSNRHGQKHTVAHNWANGVNSQYKKDTVAGSLYYEGDTIYSYGRHFPIAVIHKDKKRGNVTFFTTRSYSNTTVKHISAAHSACSHHELIFCMNPDEADRGYHANNLANFEANAKAAAKHLERARKPEKYFNEIASERASAQKYASYFKIKLSKRTYPFLFLEPSAETLQKIRDAHKKEEQAKQRAFEAVLKGFRTFTNRKGEYTDQIGGIINPKDHNAAYLRYNPQSKRIETSKGVEIPIEAARRFYKWLIGIRATGCNGGECSQQILHYSVKYVNANEFTVGCHTIQMSEADAIAKLLKW